MGKKYTIGVDFGTLSGRAILVDISTGEEIASHITTYENGIITDFLPRSNVRLESDTALQHPNDYLEVLYRSIPAIIEKSKINTNDIVGIGVDFTTCTMLPTNDHFQPLCLTESFRHEPHAWVKLWRHHSAQTEATLINEVAEKEGEDFLKRYGGKLSSEWMLPKILETLRKAPSVYEAADLFLEAGDWITAVMTGKLVRNQCMAGFKSTWNRQSGYPNNSFLIQLDPRLNDLAKTKLRGDIYSIGTPAGTLCSQMAEKLGLKVGLPVATAVGDAHAGAIGAGAVTSGQLLMAMGTSTCHLLVSNQEAFVEGISGVVADGIVQGLYAYEAGQAAVGDLFGWFTSSSVPTEVSMLAKREGVSIHQWLERRAALLKPGESGLLALDWWNGNRSVLNDANLSGLLIGYTLSTRPEEVYRALIEATAFGTRVIIDNYKKAGIVIERIITCGGIPNQNQLFMQIYADVLNTDLYIAGSDETAALGAAICAATAAGKSSGGYSTLQEATKHMTQLRNKVYQPNPSAVETYNELFKDYTTLHDYLGRGTNDVMRRLRAISHRF